MASWQNEDSILENRTKAQNFQETKKLYDQIEEFNEKLISQEQLIQKLVAENTDKQNTIDE